MKRVDLEAIKAREKAASPGPWNVVGECLPLGKGWQDGGEGSSIESPIIEYENPTPPHCYEVIIQGGADDEQGGAVGILKQENSEFIAHSRQDIPALIAEVEAMRVENDKLREALLADRSEGNYHDDGENEPVCGHCGSYKDCGHKATCYYELRRIALAQEKP